MFDKKINIVINILKNAKSLSFFLEVGRKISNKLKKKSIHESKQWARQQCRTTTEEFMSEIDGGLYEEVVSVRREIQEDGEARLLNMDVLHKGPANYILLYFLVRKFKPHVVIETGVGQGWSSLAILRAIKMNGFGKLYSSDFPYLTVKNPERYIGIVARGEPNFKEWHLDVRGDMVALPLIVSEIRGDSGVLFHYDSDKSYSGRANALAIVRKKLKSNSVVVFDDVQDNFHFRDMQRNRQGEFMVFEYEGKYTGVMFPDS